MYVHTYIYTCQESAPSKPPTWSIHTPLTPRYGVSFLSVCVCVCARVCMNICIVPLNSIIFLLLPSCLPLSPSTGQSSCLSPGFLCSGICQPALEMMRCSSCLGVLKLVPPVMGLSIRATLSLWLSLCARGRVRARALFGTKLVPPFMGLSIRSLSMLSLSLSQSLSLSLTRPCSPCR